MVTAAHQKLTISFPWLIDRWGRDATLCGLKWGGNSSELPRLDPAIFGSGTGGSMMGASAPTREPGSSHAFKAERNAQRRWSWLTRNVFLRGANEITRGLSHVVIRLFYQVRRCSGRSFIRRARPI